MPFSAILFIIFLSIFDISLCGDRDKPALITYPDVALNYVSCFQGLLFCPEAASLMLRNFCIYHIDAPGHELGADVISSDEPLLCVDDLADQVAEVLDFFGLREVMCMGVTAGAYILTLFAMKYKERVLRLILVSPICKGPSWTEWIYNKVLMNLLYFYGMCGLLKECLLQRYFSKELRCSIEGSESEVILTCRRVHSLFCFVCVKFIMLNIFVAGTDTSTYTLEWAMAELMHNPEIMSKVQNELEQVVGKGIPVEETDIAKLPYMQAVIKETFRVHPPVPLLLPRKAETDVEIGDYIIPKDAQVLVNAWVIGRDPSKWENPNAFVPERFFNSEIDFKGHHFELIPFGSGRRICPGLPLAIRMLPLMLGSLVNCFDWRLEDGLNVDDLNKEDEYGITLEKSQPVRIVPIKLTKQ
ncbi:unnamed protein product [Vicia faba]|uniref:Cytochrome P450 n=1 Tax=Vicia faba TaxID=3906 RepID=A0AAV0Z0P7_VICFA|nr:unnamed protein product [Vicia faba]